MPNEKIIKKLTRAKDKLKRYQCDLAFTLKQCPYEHSKKIIAILPDFEDSLIDIYDVLNRLKKE